jgi:ligand-binding sensor domain-containing protein/two-component sensor histidine kinase
MASNFTIKKIFVYKEFLFFLFTLLLPGLFTTQFSQEKSVNYVHILSEDGLSQNTVHSILQDKKGFMWFATEDGLNKYDGYKFTIYRNDPLDRNSLPDNFIWKIYEDKSDNLWIGTNNEGLCRYDEEKGEFIDFKNNQNDPNSLSYNNVRAIFEDSKGNLWIGTEGGGLDKLNKKGNNFIHFKHNPNNQNSLSSNVVLTIFEDKEGEMWIGGNGGLDKFDRSTGKFYNYSFNVKNKNSLSNNVVLSMCEDGNGCLWIGTLNGLTKFDKKKNTFTRFLMNSQFEGADYDRINALMVDNAGVLWIGTGSGVFLLNTNTNKIINEGSTPHNSGILINNNILSLYEDKSGVIWIGTAEDGIVKYDKERIRFKYYQHDPYNKNSLSNNTIRAIFEENNGTLWIGTLGGGLDKYDPHTNSYSHFVDNPYDKFSINDNSVSAIFKDSFGTLWVGTWKGGLNKAYNSSKGNLKFVHYLFNPFDAHSLSNNIVQSIFEDSEKRLWIGTGVGLDLYNKKKNNFIRFEHDPNNKYSISGDLVQSCIIQDKSGNLWIGTWNGLNKLTPIELKKALTNPSSVKFISYRFGLDKNGLSDNRVISLLEGKNGDIWIGTYGGGLNQLTLNQQNLEHPKFIKYTTSDGLPSNVIYSIQQDDNGNLWLSTDNGLSRFNLSSKIFRNYDVNDGLQENQFFWGAGFKGKNGQLFFGGTKGLISFYPTELNMNNHIPPIVITDFQIFNKPVGINTKDSPLTKPITATKKIILSYSQNVFSFEFAALDFTAPNKNKYAYMMEGFDKNWILSNYRRYVTYTNLDPGKYIFRVIGSNNDGVWNKKGVSLEIDILPPFWRTWWFISISILLIGGFVVFIIIYRVRNLLAVERLRTKIAADLHDNIGSSLTEISILSEVIYQKLDSVGDDVKKSLKMISDKSRSLIDSMSDIVWLVNPKRDSLYDLILRLRDTYTELSSYASISFRSENLKSLERVSLSMEHRQHLYLIFKEGINNCISHSGCTEISLDAFVKGKHLEMILKDNGKGFDISQKSSGNGLDNMKQRAKSIGGVINIFSEKGKGTTIQFVGDIL